MTRAGQLPPVLSRGDHVVDDAHGAVAGDLDRGQRGLPVDRDGPPAPVAPGVGRPCDHDTRDACVSPGRNQLT